MFGNVFPKGEEFIPPPPPVPPFTRESAIQKVRLAEDGWNSRDPAKVALAYAIDSRWRNRSEFINGQRVRLRESSPEKAGIGRSTSPLGGRVLQVSALALDRIS